MRFTKIPTDTFQKLQLNAGVLASDFTPATGTLDMADCLGATSGGVTFTAKPTLVDLGDNIDNCPKNVKELVRLDGWEVGMSGSFMSMDAARVKSLLGAADVSNTTTITPRSDISTADFTDVWWIGDYSNYNGDTNGGYIAIHMKNALSTGGFKLQSGNKQKGKFDFEYKAYYASATPTAVPCEIFVKAGTAE